jgi:hypothetical protein
MDHGSSSSHSSGDSSDHTGVAIGSGTHHGPNRQPSNHGHGGHRGGGYYPYYYPYGYGYGYWPGLFFGWYWDDYWGDPYYYPGHYGYGYGRGYGYGHYDRSSREDMGALDLDISPGDTEVYLDGERIGTVDDFDGWPQYLWLPKGTYDLVFYRDGYKTLARQVSVYPGLVVDMDDRLEQGQSVLPQDLQTKTHERRDDRMRYERKRGERIDRGEWDPRSRDDDNWRDRHHKGHDQGDREDRDADDDADGRPADAGRSSDSGWLHINVIPEDASVYLDGRFVGTGTELNGLQHGLRVDGGKHHLAVVRPGHKPVEQDFEADAGQSVKISIDLANGG